MWKKALLGVIFMSIWSMLLTNVYPYPATSGTWGAKPKCVLVWSDWLGVANFEKKPTNVEVTIKLLVVQLHYINPGGQGGGAGNPFYPDAIVTGEQALDQPVTKNGKYHSEITFTNDTLLAAIPPESYPDPPNPNWQIDLNNPIEVLEMYVTIRGYSDIDFDAQIDDETAHVAGTCTLNYDRTEYICVTEELWGWKSNNQVCPYEVPNP